MKKKKLSEFSIEELNNEKNQLKGILIGAGIVMLILYVILLYIIFVKEKATLIAIIPATLIAILPGAIRMKQINDELKSRSQ